MKSKKMRRERRIVRWSKHCFFLSRLGTKRSITLPTPYLEPKQMSHCNYTKGSSLGFRFETQNSLGFRKCCSKIHLKTEAPLRSILPSLPDLEPKGTKLPWFAKEVPSSSINLDLHLQLEQTFIRSSFVLDPEDGAFHCSKG